MAWVNLEAMADSLPDKDLQLEFTQKFSSGTKNWRHWSIQTGLRTQHVKSFFSIQRRRQRRRRRSTSQRTRPWRLFALQHFFSSRQRESWSATKSTLLHLLKNLSNCIHRSQRAARLQRQPLKARREVNSLIANYMYILRSISLAAAHSSSIYLLTLRTRPPSKRRKATQHNIHCLVVFVRQLACERVSGVHARCHARPGLAAAMRTMRFLQLLPLKKLSMRQTVQNLA